MEFEHERIDDNPPCGRLTFCLTEDLTGNDRPDVIVGGIGEKKEIHPFGKRVVLTQLPGIGDVIRSLESNVFWYENPGWERHETVDVPNLSVGASLLDVTRNGREDLVVGQNLDTDLYWFEQPTDPRDQWEKHLVTDQFEKYHDTIVGDIDDDGEEELVVLSQNSETVFYYDIPEEPYQSPWPESYRHPVTEGLSLEGAVVGDFDEDGSNELVAGPNLFSRENGHWEREQFATDWKWTRVAAADIDGDGREEIVLTEGDRPYHDGQDGRLGWFDPVDGSGSVLADSLYNPHTLQVADFTDSGRPDIYVAEMGLGDNDEPTHTLYLNRGDGRFEREILARGVPTHEAKVDDLTGDGRLDIVGKSYKPDPHVDVWYRRA